MQENKFITSYNNKGVPHGQWVWFSYNKNCTLNIFYVDGNEYGYAIYEKWNNNLYQEPKIIREYYAT